MTEQSVTEVNNPREENDNEETIPRYTSSTCLSFTELLASQTDILNKVLECGFSQPTPVQSQAVPLVLSGKDTIVQASTGSGKTLVFLVGLLAHLSKDNPPRNSTYALILVPTRELALQIADVFKTLTNDIAPVVIIGGDNMQGQVQKLREDARVVIGTPGRVRDIMRRPLDLRNCHYFVLDEADEMLSIGFLDDVRAILSRLPDNRQGVFVSATITPRVEMIASAFLTKPELVAVSAEVDQVPAIEHLYVNVGNELTAKPVALSDIIETERPLSAIIFCNTRSDTKLVEVFLRRRGFDARRINSDLTQKQRRKIMQKIRNQDLQFLVATDVAARGIDLEHIELVVNYSIHEQPEVYVHRTGRTGRAGRRGRAISLVSARDFQSFHFLKKMVDVKFKEYKLPNTDEISGARLAHLYEILRKEKIEVNERDLLLARKLIAEMSSIGAPEDQELLIAKLSKYTIEHLLSSETGSLDEEIAADDLSNTESDADYHHSSEHHRSKRDIKDRSQDDYRDSNRNERRPHGRRDHDTREGDIKSRSHSTRETENVPLSPQSKPSKDSTPPPTGIVASGLNEKVPAGFPPSVEHHISPHTEVRVFFSQGTNQGMTEPEFVKLAEEFAELKQSDIIHVAFRDNYGFVDLKQGKAQILIDNLNGIEYNGETLEVELATVLDSNRPEKSRYGKGHDRQGGHHNRRMHDGGHDRNRRDHGRGRREDRGRHQRRNNDF